MAYDDEVEICKASFAVAPAIVGAEDLVLRLPLPSAPPPPQKQAQKWLRLQPFAKTTELPRDLLFTQELRSEFLELLELQRQRHCMYATALKRHRTLIAEIQLQLKGMALDPRAFPGGGSPDVGYRSTASAPSLRARESEVIAENAGGNVKVVVRVRGFLPRENERGAECLINMDPATQTTKLLIPAQTDPANSKTQSRKIMEEKSFTFDNSFWSFSEQDAHYSNQEDIYNALGEDFLDHNFGGYHTCIFAYGQTGSGKSYTMMGNPKAPGLIPRTCEDLFQRIEANDSPYISYSVRVSYFEVYNEHVRDLLAFPLPNAPKGKPVYCKIREHPTEGPYIKDLTEMTVKSYQDLMRYMKLGDIQRTTASTKMNDTSSRSHAVFTIVLKQIHHDLSTDSTTERLARIRLVDLAGSERAKATEATGARLREGSNINKSLTTLGRVIAALADPRHGRLHTGGKGRSKDVVPYRDSILTWLLKDSLGGNSKTAMIACIAPADYDETLSTLRYADQAKRIRTRAIVNQDSVSAAQRDAQIEDLQRQIQELQIQVSQANEKTGQADVKKTHQSNGASDPAMADKLEQYQSSVTQMSRAREEERMVFESKLRQMQEQNESLQRHLHLVVESIKKPIPSPEFTEALREWDENTRNLQQRVEAHRRDFSGPPPKRVSAVGVAANPGHDGGATDIQNIENLGRAETPAFSIHEDAQDVHQGLDELMEQLNMWRRKVDDDRRRFALNQADRAAAGFSLF